MLGQRVHHRRVLRLPVTDQLLNLRRAQVGGHHHHGVAEVDRAALTVGQTTVFQHLQQHVEHIRMRLLDLIHQDHRVRLTTHRFGQITAFFVTDVARRRTDQASNRMLLHELGHVDPHHGVLGVKQELGQCLAQLGFTHTGRAKEHERATRAVRVCEPCTGATYGVGHRDHRLMLTDHALVQRIFHTQQLVALALKHFGHRNTGPLGDDLGDFLVGHLVAQQLVLRLGVLLGHLLAAFQVRDHAILQLGHAVQVTLAPRLFQLGLGLLDFFLDLRRALHVGFLSLPDLFQIGVLALNPGNFFLQLLQPLQRCIVVFLLQRLALNLELNQAALQTVQRFGLGVDLHADTTGRLVDQVDGLVRQLAISDVTVRQLGRSDDRAIGNGDLVVHFVALFQATQNGDGVFFRRLIDQHLLEAPLQRRILLDVLAVFIQRGGTNAMQLAARQRRLEHIARIHGTFCLAGADHGVQLIDKQNDPAFLLGQLVEYGLEALFKLTAEFGTGDQRPHIQ